MDDENENQSSDGLLAGGSVGQTLCKKKRRPYKDMVMEAIENLKERRGSSRQSILKFIVSKYALGRGSTARVNSVITKMFKSKQLLRTRGSLEDGSFKLNSKHMTPFASAGRSKRRGFRSKSSRSKRRGKKSKKRRIKKRGKKSKKKGKKGKKRGKKGKRVKKRKGSKGKKKKRPKPQPSFFPRLW